MAEVEKMTAAPPTDIPVSSPNASEAGGGSSSTAELGTSPNQEPSSNSHPHDSEYDTASDLEGGEDYDDESGSEEDSETDEDDVGSETTEDDRQSGTVSGNDNCQDRSVADSEAQKKVDEDRSNPQYIPKRGTFYEHDDRTAETEGGPVLETESSSQTLPESNGEVNGVSASGATPSGQPPTISQASKTMKQWQPASGGDRWSHDRFEAADQAPKSRAELLQSYGYDIRNEDAPPRARRRRRYTRGPSKYSRNWEDEQAYLKASNKERKPPRPQDFPALNERKPRRPRTSSFREEKENRRSERGGDKPQGGGGGGGGAGGASGSNPAPRAQEVERERERDRDREREREPKNRNYGRVNGGPARQNPMEFKPKSNRGPPPDRRERGERGDRGERGERDREQDQVDQRNERPHQKPSTPRSNGQAKPTLQQSQQQPPPQQQRQSPQQVQQPPLAAPQTQLSTTNLSQRLQQVQQRNDPSHVGSVQMHSLANQNQQQQQQQLQLTQQAQPAAPEPRTAPKRYSSLRRSQQEASQHLAEQQQQQQLQQQLHLQQQQQQQPSQIMIQDPHVLMQFAYQQQEMQAQLQTLQLGPAAAAVPAPPKQHAPPAAAYPQAQGAPYYVTGAEPVPVQVPVSVSVPPASPYVNPASAAYLPTTPAAVAFAQAQTSVVTQPQPQPPAQAPTPAAAAQAPPSMNFHQNYNTVGGTTYFVPPVQTTSRPAALPQRRPTNAIPILPPSEKHKTRPGGLAGPNANQTKEEGGHADNIDHIIDNMFVQRPAFQPPATGEAAAAGAKEDVANSNPILPSLAAAEQNLQPVPAAGQE
ncbi:protein CASC3 [Drosophila obscura]|uniref:protein CASC3 n=1 Tax=Drosophila obscura TaxID=7282 RepID=UPI001BB2601B|nr:protein CASC3 [Drosophila obscura]